MNVHIWEAFVPFRGTSFTQSFLQTCYHQRHVKQSKTKSYANTDPFISYIEHGQRHYDLARSAPLELQPLLLFYGMTQLLKACLLIEDPDYPQNTAVLAHGVSTRKRKKQHYTFLDDIVRIQKYGLAVQVAKQLFQRHHMVGQTFTMRALLAHIPDLNFLFADINGNPPFYCLQAEDKMRQEIPFSILDDLHMTTPRFCRFLEAHAGIDAQDLSQTDHSFCLQSKHALHLPISREGAYFLPRHREYFDGIPEMLVHLLLLYNLSMICRYETTWWSELFHYTAGDDLPFVTSFLHVTAEKGPLLISRFLRKEMATS